MDLYVCIFLLFAELILTLSFDVFWSLFHRFLNWLKYIGRLLHPRTKPGISFIPFFFFFSPISFILHINKYFITRLRLTLLLIYDIEKANPVNTDLVSVS